MARARHLWAVAAVLLVGGAALAQSSWPAQIVDTAPSGTCTAATYKGAVIVRNTADMWRCLDLDGDSTATWAQIRTVRFQDLDTDADGIPDHRVIGDFDGDGTLESDDIQDAIDGFCDADGDGTQDRTIAIDSDSDGSVDETSATCGTVLVLDGTYTTAASGASSRLFIKWGGLTVRLGKGAVIKSGITTSELWSRNTPGTGVLYNEVVTIGDYLMTTGVERVRFEGGTIVGVGWADRAAQCTTYSCTDALDADQDGTTDGAQHGLAIYACDDCAVVGVTIRDCDRIGLYTGGDLAAGGQRVSYIGNTVQNVGEHCSAHNLATITATGNTFRNCDALNRHFGALKDGGRVFEVYASGTETADGNRQLVFSGNVAEGFNDGVATLYNTGTTVTFDDFNVTNNSFHDFTGYAVRLQTTAAAHTIQNVSVSGNTIGLPQSDDAYGIIVQESAGTINTITISSNNIRMSATGDAAGSGLMYGILAQGDSFTISGNMVETASDGTASGGQYDGCFRIFGDGHAVSGNTCYLSANKSAAGFHVQSVTKSTFSGNVVRSAATAGTVDGFYLLNVTDTTFSGNTVSNAMRAFYGWGSGGNIQRNFWTGNKCYNTNNCISIDTAGTNTQNVAIGNEANDCNFSSLSWAWADHESAGTAGSNFWDGNIATGCYVASSPGSSRAGNSHGTVWMIDEDANSTWDTNSYQRFSDLSLLDLHYDRGIRFRNAAGNKFVTLKMGGEPYLGTATTLSLPAADGVVTVAPITGFPLSQCTQWDASGYLTGTGAACAAGDVTQVGGCSSAACFQSGMYNINSSNLCWTDSPSDHQFCIYSGGTDLALDIQVTPPAAGTVLCAKGDAGCGTYATGMDSDQDGTSGSWVRATGTGYAKLTGDADEDGNVDYGFTTIPGSPDKAYLYLKAYSGACPDGGACTATGIGIDNWCNNGGMWCYCNGTTWECGSSKSLEKGDFDEDGTSVIEVNGPFTNLSATSPTAFQFDANGDEIPDSELAYDGTNSGLWLKEGAGYIKFGVAAKLKVKLCGVGADAGFFYDEDDDGTYDAADDFCWGLGGYDFDCDCNVDQFGDMLEATYDADSDSTVDAAEALAADPSDCASGAYATAIAASGNLTCSTPVQTLNFTGATAVCNADPALFKAPFAMTITAIHCAVWAATSFPLSVEECSSTIGSCAGVDGATTITCDTDGATDDGSLSNPSIDAGDWIKLNFGTASGTPVGTTVTIYYTTP